MQTYVTVKVRETQILIYLINVKAVLKCYEQTFLIATKVSKTTALTGTSGYVCTIESKVYV